MPAPELPNHPDITGVLPPSTVLPHLGRYRPFGKKLIGVGGLAARVKGNQNQPAEKLLARGLNALGAGVYPEQSTRTKAASGGFLPGGGQPPVQVIAERGQDNPPEILHELVHVALRMKNYQDGRQDLDSPLAFAVPAEMQAIVGGELGRAIEQIRPGTNLRNPDTQSEVIPTIMEIADALGIAGEPSEGNRFTSYLRQNPLSPASQNIVLSIARRVLAFPGTSALPVQRLQADGDGGTSQNDDSAQDETPPTRDDWSQQEPAQPPAKTDPLTSFVQGLARKASPFVRAAADVIEHPRPVTLPSPPPTGPLVTPQMALRPGPFTNVAPPVPGIGAPPPPVIQQQPQEAEARPSVTEMPSPLQSIGQEMLQAVYRIMRKSRAGGERPIEVYTDTDLLDIHKQLMEHDPEYASKMASVGVTNILGMADPNDFTANEVSYNILKALGEDVSPPTGEPALGAPRGQWMPGELKGGQPVSMVALAGTPEQQPYLYAHEAGGHAVHQALEALPENLSYGKTPPPDVGSFLTPQATKHLVPGAPLAEVIHTVSGYPVRMERSPLGLKRLREPVELPSTAMELLHAMARPESASRLKNYLSTPEGAPYLSLYARIAHDFLRRSGYGEMPGNEADADRWLEQANAYLEKTGNLPLANPYRRVALQPEDISALQSVRRQMLGGLTELEQQGRSLPGFTELPLQGAERLR